MNIKRKITTLYSPQGLPGFLGAGHVARQVVQGDFTDTDPFILLMDDHLDKKDNNPVGGPHPHAGFETVSLLLEGSIGDEEHQMKSGDLQIMTAGSGVVHTETISEKAKMRLLQMWLTLPGKDRWTKPKEQNLPLAHTPVLTAEGLKVKVYSGSLEGVSSPVENYVPLILADIEIAADNKSTLHIPANFTAFLYVIEGELWAGDNRKPLKNGDVAWLDRFTEKTESELSLETGNEGARLVLYAAEPQQQPIVSYGPFIGDTKRDIQSLYHAYNSGQMKHISTLPREQKITW